MQANKIQCIIELINFLIIFSMNCQEATQALNNIRDHALVVSSAISRNNKPFLGFQAKEKIQEIINSFDREILAKPEDAERILGEDFLGIKQIETALGIELDTKDIPPIPFALKQLKEAKRSGFYLVYRSEKFNLKKERFFPHARRMEHISNNLESNILVINELAVINESLKDNTKSPHNNRLLANSNPSYIQKEYFTPATPGWFLVSKNLVPEICNKTYIEQTRIIYQNLKSKKSKSQLEESMIAEAEQLYLQCYNDGNPITEEQTEGYLNDFLNLRINQLLRPSPADVFFDEVIYYKNSGKKLNSDRFIATNAINDDLTHPNNIRVGGFDDRGMKVQNIRLDNRWPDTGVPEIILG